MKESLSPPKGEDCYKNTLVGGVSPQISFVEARVIILNRHWEQASVSGKHDSLSPPKGEDCYRKHIGLEG